MTNRESWTVSIDHPTILRMHVPMTDQMLQRLLESKSWDVP